MHALVKVNDWIVTVNTYGDVSIFDESDGVELSIGRNYVGALIEAVKHCDETMREVSLRMGCDYPEKDE